VHLPCLLCKLPIFFIFFLHFQDTHSLHQRKLGCLLEAELDESVATFDFIEYITFANIFNASGVVLSLLIKSTFFSKFPSFLIFLSSRDIEVLPQDA